MLVYNLLLFVYWLGSDVGVFYGVRYVTNPSLSLDARRTAMSIVHWIDALPRICLVLMVPVGTSLATLLGLVDIREELQPALLATVWVVGIAWLVLVMRIYNGNKGWLTRVDYVIRIGTMVGFIGAGLASLFGHGPLQPGTEWLAMKMILFGLIICCGLSLRVLGKPFGEAYGAIMADGSTPEQEDKLRKAMGKSKRVVMLLWVLVLTTAWVGLTKGG